jgi:hypothetical protein
MRNGFMPEADCFGGVSPPSPERGAERGQMERKPFHNKMEVKRKMAKENRKILSIAVLLMLMLISSAYATLMPNVHAAEPTAQDKAIAILNNVVGINTEEYATFRSSQLDNNYLSMLQNEADIKLVSNRSSFRASCSFVNNNLRQIYLSDYEGDLAVKQPAIATADMAKGFLQRYQNYAGDSFCGQLASMLDNVDVSTNVTKSTGNIKLEVLNWNQTIIDYVWTYTDENGILAKSKNVILSYDQGLLKVFLNNWPFYNVVGAPKITSEEATAIALEASKNFSYEVEIDNVTSTITGFKIAPESLGRATLSYLNFPNQSLARGADPFTLHPSWYVPLGFDRSYPGGVTGMTVSIWADTGEVSIMGPMVVDKPLLNSTEIEGFAISAESAIASAPFVAVTAFTAIGVAILRRKKLRFAGGRKLLYPKFIGTLLCGTILLSAILVTVPTVFANDHMPNSKARIYAALEGSPEYPPDGSPPQLQDEQDAAYWVSGQIANAFSYSGYTVSNDAGVNTRAAWIPSQAESDEQGYDNVTVFHFGHLADFNIGYVDNYGVPVWADDIDDHTSLGTHSFVFIWVCAQAQDPTHGTPAAWTYRGPDYNTPALNDDGYLHPDGLRQAYIGFEGVSPQISANHQTFRYQIVDPLQYFIGRFYNYSLRIGYSVKDSLNRATLDYFGNTFTNSILNTGYEAWFDDNDPNTINWWEGRMRVFGDGNMRIVQPRITLAANTAIAPTFYLDGVPHSLGDINAWAWPRQYTIQVSDVPCYTFDHFHYEEANGGWWDIYFKPVTISFEYSGTFTAVYTPIQQPLTISSSGSGYTTPTGTQWYDPYTYAHVQAYPNPGYDLYWLVNGYYAGNSPTIDVYMLGPRNLQAVFYPEQPHSFVAGIDSYDGAVYDPENLAGWQNDGQFATIEGYGPYQYFGYIIGAMNEQAAGHIYMYGYGNGPLYVYASSDGYNFDLVSVPYVSSGSPYWIDGGTYLSPFNYIAVTAEDPNSMYSIALDSVKVEPPVYYDLTIIAGPHGSTNPAPGVHADIPGGTPYSVTAVPDPGYVLDYWRLDGQPAGSDTTIIVPMNSDRTLEAFFREGAVYHTLTVDAYDGYLGNPLYSGIWIDGDLKGYGYVSVPVTEGWHIVEVEDPVWNDYFGFYDYFSYFTDGYGNGANHPVYSDTYITAVYYPW